MLVSKNSFFACCVLLFSLPGSLQAIFPINILRPYDEFYYLNSQGESFQFYGVAEHGFKSQGRAENGDKVQPFQLWQCSQNSLAMFNGFAPDSQEGQFVNQFGNIIDDGSIGHLIPKADVEYNGCVMSARWYVPYDISLSIHVPIYSMSVKNVNWCDLTLDDGNATGQLVRQELTSKIASRTQEFGNLYLGGWKRTGIGDLVFAARWMREFPQIKQLLRTVTLNVGGGLTVPTAKTQNICNALDINFGNDGAAGLFIEGGIDLRWEYHLRAGIDALFLHLFNSSATRRIKIDPAQTDILELVTAPSVRDFALTQRYNIFLELNKIFRGLSLRATYQFWQHGGDLLSLKTNSFSTNIASTARRFDDWTMHNLIFLLFYDTQDDFYSSAKVTPAFSFYYKLPINGSGSILMHGIGGALVLNF
ncbi:MAG TPA: hypothetical protein VJ201_00850 [Candidatus Babeliales bacterium]|nr:hypothetical protein [Candidatus Babeliales bacterium]